MGLEGPEIVSGDLAADLEIEFTDKFNEGADQEELEYWAAMALEEMVLDELDREIWVSVCAQCFWEVGMLSPDFIDMFEGIISEEVGIQFREQHGLGDARRKELEDLKKKISEPNPNPKARQTYSRIEDPDLIFPHDTAVSFQVNSGEYRIAIVTEIYQYRGDCNYPLCSSDL